MAFISNGAWIDANVNDGFRKCLEREFSTIYVLNLRGNQRTSGELSEKEGGKIFDSGSRTPMLLHYWLRNLIKQTIIVLQYTITTLATTYRVRIN